MSRSPNFLITGTPGTGKSTLCKKLMEELTKEEYVYINIGELVKKNKYLEEYDEKRDCHVLDEKKLIDHLDKLMKKENKGTILDYHGCDLFEPEWLQAIFVLRTKNDILYDRLKERKYSDSKIEENIQCEIFQVILDEASEAFGDYDIEIIELENNNEEDQQKNIEKILDWIKEKNTID